MSRFAAALLIVPVITLLTLLAWEAALADGPSADVTIVPDGELTVGDPVEVRVTISHEPGDRVLIDGSVVQLGEMEPSAAVISEISETETLVVFQTRSFIVGTFDVQLPPILLQRADGSLAELSPRPLTIAITSVLSGNDEPRPLTGPDLLAGNSRTFAPWIVAIIGVGLGFILARLVRRRYQRPAASGAAEEPDNGRAARPAFAMDAALGAADQCRALANSVRSRLADDWSLPASALTSSEIGPALAAAGAPGVVVLRVTRLLEACDRVQYGGERPTPERLSGYLQLAEAIWSEGRRRES